MSGAEHDFESKGICSAAGLGQVGAALGLAPLFRDRLCVVHGLSPGQVTQDAEFCLFCTGGDDLLCFILVYFFKLKLLYPFVFTKKKNKKREKKSKS